MRRRSIVGDSWTRTGTRMLSDGLSWWRGVGGRIAAVWSQRDGPWVECAFLYSEATFCISLSRQEKKEKKTRPKDEEDWNKQTRLNF
jgi:hypothetical protein